MEARLGVLEQELSGLRRDLADTLSQFNKQKTDFKDATELEFTQHKLILGEVVEGARTEFVNIKAAVNDLYAKTEASIGEIQQKIISMENTAGGGRDRTGGYLPQKNMIPKPFSDKAEDWRQWSEDVADYLDSVNPGMKQLLDEINKLQDPVDDKWKSEREFDHPAKVFKDQVNVWRALKKLTDGEAKKVVMSVKKEDGFRAWQKLKQRFEPGLAARQGVVIADFSGMVARPAKTPTETMALITEMEKKIKNVEDLTEEVISDMHMKSVLVGILDPMTRQHTAMHHADDFHTLKKTVLEFANNATANVDAMQIGSLGGETIPAQDWSQHEAEDGQGWERCYHHLDALGKGGGVRCYNCQGEGHIARNCPSKGWSPKGFGKGGKAWEPPKGKGKGGFYGGGKGKGGVYGGEKGQKGGSGKGPRYGKCYICEGDHSMAPCPNKGGKG